MPWALLISCGLFLGLPGIAWPELQPIDLSAIEQVQDLSGRSLELQPPDSWTVLIFVRPDCPISNRYTPELRRLHDEYAGRGVEFRAVYPGLVPRPDARSHHRQYQIPFAALLDRAGELVEATGVQVTPEAVVLDRDGRLYYRGRIDDTWIALGQPRHQATQHDLADAIEAVLAGRAVKTPETRAIGCYIDPL